MATYKAPLREIGFVLEDVLNVGRLSELPPYAEATPDVLVGLADEAAKLIEDQVAPLNHPGDAEGCRLDNHEVTVPKGMAEAYKLYWESGWVGLSNPVEFGGQGLPYALHSAVGEYFSSANMAFAMYFGLTQGAMAAIHVHGSDEQKQAYLPKMVEGTWTGTMNLTEPHCGTDLGLLRTKAVPQGDGSYRISGQKIFISAGEHDMSENIIHLVLARIEGAPDGVKGISLFIVPKFDPESGERNGVSCGSIEEKMGIHGNSTCVMNYDEAKGWMVGEENKGLAAMFIMMNAARLGVGIQGLSQAEVSYQNAVTYALDRRQGRALTGPAEPNEKADPIFVHPDVRRMLMDAKAFNEGMRAFALWTALQQDLSHALQDEDERQLADDLVGLMTPVIKGYGTDKGYDVATNMQQVYGGHGYIAEWCMEQFVRDARIAQIYEGTNGVQAMDLCGRKLAQHGGRAVQAFFKLVDDTVAEAKGEEELAELATALEKAVGEQKAATMWFMQNAMANPNDLGAGAHHYMHIMGIACLMLMWVKMARVAKAALAEGSDDKAFYEAKIATARYFADRFVPDAGALRRKIESGSESMMALGEEAFATAS